MNLKDFENYLKINTNSDDTRKQYLKNVNKFFKSFDSFNQETINQFLAMIVDMGRGESTFNGYIKAFKQYALYLNKEFQFPKYKKSNKKKKTDKKKYITKEELSNDILPYFDLIFEKAEKRKVILLLMFTTGMRPREIVKLKKDDIDFDNNCILLKNTKNDKDRYAYIIPELKPRLKMIMDESNTDSVFNVKYRYINYTFEKFREYLNYDKKATAYFLRRGFGIESLKAGVPINYLQELMGHWDISMTEEYITVSDDDIKKLFLDKFRLTNSK